MLNSEIGLNYFIYFILCIIFIIINFLIASIITKKFIYNLKKLSMNIIELKNLSLSYKTKSFIPNDNKNLHLPKDEDFYALKDINLSIEKKSVIGLYGPNGAGKSTLLKVIGKILKPNSGSVFTKFEPELMSSSQFNFIR